MIISCIFPKAIIVWSIPVGYVAVVPGNMQQVSPPSNENRFVSCFKLAHQDADKKKPVTYFITTKQQMSDNLRFWYDKNLIAIENRTDKVFLYMSYVNMPLQMNL